MRSWICLILLLTAAGSAGAQTVDYYQNFPANGSGSFALSGCNWQGYYGNSSTNVVQAGTGMGTSSPNAQISGGGNSTVTNHPNVNATTPPGSSDSTGLAFFAAPIGSGYSYILLSNPSSPNEYTVARNGGTTDPADFTWYGAGTSGDTQRLAIEIGAQWYVNTSVLTIGPTTTNSASNFAADEQQKTVLFNTNASSWQLLSFSTTGASTLSIGNTLSAPLPSGDIISFGVYMTCPGGSTPTVDKDFIDNFEIDATPEPALGLVLLAPVALMRKRRS